MGLPVGQSVSTGSRSPGVRGQVPLRARNESSFPPGRYRLHGLCRLSVCGPFGRKIRKGVISLRLVPIPPSGGLSGDSAPIPRKGGRSGHAIGPAAAPPTAPRAGRARPPGTGPAGPRAGPRTAIDSESVAGERDTGGGTGGPSRNPTRDTGRRTGSGSSVPLRFRFLRSSVGAWRVDRCPVPPFRRTLAPPRARPRTSGACPQWKTRTPSPSPAYPPPAVPSFGRTSDPMPNGPPPPFRKSRFRRPRHLRGIRSADTFRKHAAEWSAAPWRITECL